jgi:hypothetical protein
MAATHSTCCPPGASLDTSVLHMITPALPHCRFVSNTTFPRQAVGGEKLAYEAQLPWWYDQLHDWEAAAAAGAPTTPPLQPETTFRLFTTDVSSPAFFARAAVKAAAGAVGSKQELAGRLKTLSEKVGGLPPAAVMQPWHCFSCCCADAVLLTSCSKCWFCSCACSHSCPCACRRLL